MVRPMLVALLLLLMPAIGRAGEDYYLLMFGSQRIPNTPNYTHSFATFVRVTWAGDGPRPPNPCVEEHTISWLPESGKVRTLALLPECGRNFGLHETMRWCQCNDMRISLWGPYRVEPELYHLALKQQSLLESGQVRYKAADMGYPTDRVSDCIHATSSVVAGYRMRIATPGWGERASFAILLRFEPYIIQAGCTQPWLGTALCLDQYPIIYRDWEQPRSGPLGPAYRLFGGERDLHATYGPPNSAR